MNEVVLLDSMGDDLAIVNAARVSMAKQSHRGENGQLKPEDVKLINYLAKHNHFTPFGQVTFKFRFKMPIFVVRQWYKHKVGLIENEVSRRYVSDEPEFFMPEYFRPAAENVKQGSDDVKHENSEFWKKRFDFYYVGCKQMYLDAIADGVCPEQARMILPQAMMTEFIQTGSLAAYARICKLRQDNHAQKEIQWYANEVSEAIEMRCPVSWKALMEN